MVANRKKKSVQFFFLRNFFPRVVFSYKDYGGRKTAARDTNEVLCSAVCKFTVYVLMLSITFDTEGRFIALWNFVFFQSSRFLGRLR